MVTQSNQAATVKKQTEKMALWKIIVLAVSLTIIAALIVTIIVFACVKVNLTPNITFGAEDGITVYYNSSGYTGSQTYGTNKVENVKITNKLTNGFSTSLLNSFTEGLNSKNSYDIKYYASNSKSYASMKSGNKYAVTFMFNKDKTLKNADGKDFTYGSYNTTYKYRYMTVLLNDSNGDFGELEIWFFTETSAPLTENGGSAYVKLTAYGDFSDVLDYLDELSEKVL